MNFGPEGRLVGGGWSEHAALSRKSWEEEGLGEEVGRRRRDEGWKDMRGRRRKRRRKRNERGSVG